MCLPGSANTCTREPACTRRVSYLPERTGLKRSASSSSPRSARHAHLTRPHTTIPRLPHTQCGSSHTNIYTGLLQRRMSPRHRGQQVHIHTAPTLHQEGLRRVSGARPTGSGCLWMGLAGISSSLWSHHDPQISAPHRQNTNSIRRERGPSLDVDSA